MNILGNGIDIPLLGLREASKEVDGEYHELFTDESYKIAQCFLLSTSQVQLPSVMLLNCTKNQNALDSNSKALNLKLKARNVRILQDCTIKFIFESTIQFVARIFLAKTKRQVQCTNRCRFCVLSIKNFCKKIIFHHLRSRVQRTASWATVPWHPAATDVPTTRTPKKLSSACQLFSPPTTPARRGMQNHFRIRSKSCETCWKINSKSSRQEKLLKLVVKCLALNPYHRAVLRRRKLLGVEYFESRTEAESRFICKLNQTTVDDKV